MKLSAFESAECMCAQYGNGVVTSVVEAGRSAEQTETYRQEKDKEDEPFAASDEKKTQKIDMVP